MAFKLTGKKTLALTTLQVQEARRMFFINLQTTKVLAEQYGVSERTMKDVVHAKHGYARIPDDIDENIKVMRSVNKMLNAQPESQRQQNKRAMNRNIRNGIVSPSNLIYEPPSAERMAPLKHWR